MWKSKHSVVLSLVVCFIVAVAIAVSFFFVPTFAKSYFGNWQGFEREVITKIVKTVLMCYYPTAVLGLMALGSLIKMLLNIKAEKTFVSENVTALRIISWCCFAVSAICLVGAGTYISFIFVTVAAGFVGLILRVVKNVMQTAVEIKSENDLTI